MAFKLKKGIFRVSCKNPGCTFDKEFEIPNNLMGVTEEDVESEAKKIAKDMASIKHDALFGKRHYLTNPLIRKVNCVYEAIGASAASIISQSEAVKYNEYKKGDIILRKGEIATTICEVVKGKAVVDKTQHKYEVGDTFGAAALLVNQTRTADVIASEEGTTIAFYNLKELSNKDPRKAKELYTEAMEDIFRIILDMENLIDKLDKDIEKEKIRNENHKQRITSLEADIREANKKVAELEGNF
jgi:CRP-like cAMP-binding protein